MGKKTCKRNVERTDTSEVRSSELEDRSKNVTRNAIQRYNEMKYMKERVRDMEESERVPQKSNKNFRRSNTWKIQGLRITQK